MTATHSTKWFWSDWLGDEAVRRLTLAERGMWIDLLALAFVGKPVGYVTDYTGKPLSLDEICRVTNAADVNEVAELVGRIVQKGAASRDRTGRLFNRRMAREASLSAKKRRNGQLGGEANKLKWKGINDLLRQNARQVPRQKIKPPYPKERKITSTEFGAAREEPPHVAAFRERVEKKRSAEKGKP